MEKETKVFVQISNNIPFVFPILFGVLIYNFYEFNNMPEQSASLINRLWC